MHLQLPQLKRLEASIWRYKNRDLPYQNEQQEDEPEQAATPPFQLQLGHLTALSYLECRASVMLSSDVFPVSLRSVHWTYDYEGNSLACSVQPLLKFPSLEQLNMKFFERPPAVEELQQLASLQHLSSVSFTDYYATNTPVARVEQAWGALPLKHLELNGRAPDRPNQCTPNSVLMPAVALQVLSRMTQLESLTLCWKTYKNVLGEGPPA